MIVLMDVDYSYHDNDNDNNNNSYSYNDNDDINRIRLYIPWCKYHNCSSKAFNS